MCVNELVSSGEVDWEKCKNNRPDMDVLLTRVATSFITGGFMSKIPGTSKVVGGNVVSTGLGEVLGAGQGMAEGKVDKGFTDLLTSPDDACIELGGQCISKSKCTPRPALKFYQSGKCPGSKVCCMLTVQQSKGDARCTQGWPLKGACMYSGGSAKAKCAGTLVGGRCLGPWNRKCCIFK